MDVADPADRDALGRDWRAVTEALRSSQSAHRCDSASATWRIWERFCTSSGVRSDLDDVPGDRVPLLLLFAHQYRTGRIAPSERAVRSRTVEDAVRHVAQTFTRVGAVDPRLNVFGELDYRLQAVLRTWKKADPPPTRVKPLPMLVLRRAHTLAEANLTVSPRLFAAGDCLILAFYFLLRPGEYSGAPRTADDDLFRFKDVGVWLGHRRLDPLTCPTDDLLAATFVTVTFTTQKNGVRGETLGHGRSGHPTLCPVAALTRRLLHLRLVNAAPSTPVNAFRLSPVSRWQYVLPTDVTTILRRAVALLPPSLTDFAANDISARSTRAGGAMAMLCGGIDSDRIRLIGRWRSDEMYRYLHVQAQPVMAGVAAIMLRGGDYRLNTPPLSAGTGGPPFSSSTLALLADEVPSPIQE